MRKVAGIAAAATFAVLAISWTPACVLGGGGAGSAASSEDNGDTRRFGYVEGAQVVSSEQQREQNPEVELEDAERLVQDNSAFAIDFYRALRTYEQGNLFASPLSISLALAMTYGGARGNTEAEMAEALHFTLSQEALHPAFNQLSHSLASRGGQTSEGVDWGFQLNLANGLFGQQGHSFLPEYLDLLATNYGAGMQLLDFINDAEGCAESINDWVAAETGDRIQNLIPAGTLDDATRLVLVNAIYFKAAWAAPFPDHATSTRDFYRLDETVARVPMMRQTEYLRYADGEGYKAVELPYNEYKASMIVIVPDTGEFNRFEDGLDKARLDQVLGALQGTELILSLPRWSFTTRSVKLKELLAGLGMHEAFQNFVADFSGMDGTHVLKIDEVLHKAFVEVNEAGTEAAAATAVIVADSGCAGPIEPPPSLVVDRPFIYLIKDELTDSILFVGRVLDPSVEG